MRKMAEAFNTTVSALEDELMQLILDGQINARIDSHNKVTKLGVISTFFLFKAFDDIYFSFDLCSKGEYFTENIYYEEQ